MKAKNNKATAKQTRQNYTADQREAARKYYLRGFYLTEISKLMNIPTRTLEKWQAVEKWTKIKELPEIKKRAYDLQRGGKSLKDISKLLGISITTIWRYCNAAAAELEKNKQKQI